MNKRITQRTGKLALSGVICGLAVAVMLSSALLPSMTYALPMIAGGLLLVPSVEFGARTALTAYAAVSILSMILPADKEAALMFIFLFGLYPIIKKFFERVPGRLLEYALKFLYFNAAAVAAVWLAMKIFGIPLDDGTLGQWAVPVLLVLGNITFLVYDVALSKFVWMYVQRLQPILRKTFHLGG